ncbi:MAG: fumarate hydratase [Desulfarculales bacterium]|nr:fumarate hydratase [Desulfarculales bacterium]
MSGPRYIQAEEISSQVAELCGLACCRLPEDVLACLSRAEKEEKSPVGRKVLTMLLENAGLARRENIPLCQDCGTAVVWANLGQEALIRGGDFYQAISRGVALGYDKYYLRKSMAHPFSRANSNDNTPPIVHLSLVPGRSLALTLAPKGGGAENVSRLFMLAPALGREGVVKAVLDTVDQAGANPCPPLVVSLAVGGNMEDAALRAKKNLLLRSLTEPNPDPEAAVLEEELLAAVNRLGIGPAGLGGSVTCLRVLADIKACHIASLPLAVNLQCHAARHQTVVL